MVGANSSSSRPQWMAVENCTDVGPPVVLPFETPPPPPTISADYGLPPLTNPYQNIIGPLPETGLPGAAYNDDANGLFSYIPVPGSPGSIATGAPVEYNFTSDVPEPATLGMLGVGVLGLLARRNRKGTIPLSA